MKVAFVASARSWHTYRWYRALHDRVDLRIFTFNHGMSDYGNAQHVFGEWIPQKLKYLLGSRIMKKDVLEFNPDILHAHYATGHGYVGSRLNIHPFVVSVWGSDIFDFPKKNDRARKFLRNILARADAICATSGILKRETVRLFPEVESKVHVIPFGIDLNLFKPFEGKKAHENIVLGTAKLFREIYQVDMLMRIFDNLANQVDGVELKIAGYGPDEKKLRALKEELKHGSRIEFVGHVPNDKMPGFLNSLDIFVLTSRFESFGVSALEASACGLPVVAFNTGGLHEIVQDSQTGYLVEGEDPAQFGNAVRVLIQDETKRHKMGKAGREHALKYFDMAKTADKQIDLYQSLL